MEFEEYVREELEKSGKHMAILNDEHGLTRDKVIVMEITLANLVKGFTKIDGRMWWILGSVILGFVTTIFFMVLAIYIK